MAKQDRSDNADKPKSLDYDEVVSSLRNAQGRDMDIDPPRPKTVMVNGREERDPSFNRYPKHKPDAPYRIEGRSPAEGAMNPPGRSGRYLQPGDETGYLDRDGNPIRATEKRRGYCKGGKVAAKPMVKKMAKGGSVSARADGKAQRGKTKGRFI